MPNFNYRKMPVASIFALIFFLLFSTATVTAEVHENGAKTPPPLAEYSPLGFFSPNHSYLKDGSNLFEIFDDNIFRIKGTTIAKQDVDSIGITFYLQKWDGNSWSDVGTGTTYTDSNESLFAHQIGRNAELGYYYRARTVHWVLHNDIYEEGERFSDYVLMD